MNDLINEYKTAIYNLAIEMAKVRKSKGRNLLEDVLPFNLMRIRTLCDIGDVCLDIGEAQYSRLLPEHILELIAIKTNRIKFAKRAIDKNLKPKELRLLIRKSQESEKLKSVAEREVNKWGKQIVVLENELNKMNDAEKQRALSQITNILLKI